MTDAPEQHFAELAARFLADPGVTEGTGFGASQGLRTGGKIFAMLMGGRLVVKLPRERVDALIAAGTAERFLSGQRRPMKEWASVGAEADWEALVGEARRFVGGVSAS